MQIGPIAKNAVLLRVADAPGYGDNGAFAKSITTFGFSGIVDDGLSQPTSAGVAMIASSDLNIALPISATLQGLADNNAVSGSNVWSSFEHVLPDTRQTELALIQSSFESHGSVALMVQMSLPLAPIIQLGGAPDRLPRDHAHFLRSLIFWRNRNDISGMSPRLVHAGHDGTLVYILDSWMVALNWNAEEISIDIGDTGSMWLMLGTPRDVQLHGSLLVLPAYSGAILANELAR